MTKSKIEWTDDTWNPVTGCDKVSPGCDNCYAERMAHRLKAMGKNGYENGFKLTLRHERLDDPFKWRKPRRVFVNSMSDMFHPKVPFSFIDRCLETITLARQHTFQVLTKRPKTAALWHSRWCAKHAMDEPQLPSNLWLGTSIESQDYLPRAAALREIPAAVRFLSLEPLLEDLGDLDLRGIHWVIAGGESGPGARPVHADWIRSIRDQCAEQDVPFHFKQWGGANKSKTGRVLDGLTHDGFPDARS